MIIGLTGKMAAGKGVVADYLTKRGFTYHSLSDILRGEAKARGIKENIPNLINLGNELRGKEGPGILAKRLVQKVNEAQEGEALADSIRHPAEIEEFKKSVDLPDGKAGKFVLIAVDAPQELRYQRITSRGRAGDKMTFKEFKEQDFKQLKSADPNAQQILECFKMADYTVVNDGTLEELNQKIEDILSDID